MQEYENRLESYFEQAETKTRCRNTKASWNRILSKLTQHNPLVTRAAGHVTDYANLFCKWNMYVWTETKDMRGREWKLVVAGFSKLIFQGDRS